MKKLFLIALLIINMPVMAASQSEKLRNLGITVIDRTQENAIKQEQIAESERIRRAKWIEQDMYNCMEYQKKYKDVYWDSEKGMCVIPHTPVSDTIYVHVDTPYMPTSNIPFPKTYYGTINSPRIGDTYSYSITSY